MHWLLAGPGLPFCTLCGIGRDSVSPVMDPCKETPLLFHLFPYDFHPLGPSFTVNLNELIAYI